MEIMALWDGARHHKRMRGKQHFRPGSGQMLSGRELWLGSASGWFVPALPGTFPQCALCLAFCDPPICIHEMSVTLVISKCWGASGLFYLDLPVT